MLGPMLPLSHALNPLSRVTLYKGLTHPGILYLLVLMTL